MKANYGFTTQFSQSKFNLNNCIYLLKKNIINTHLIDSWLDWYQKILVTAYKMTCFSTEMILFHFYAFIIFRFMRLSFVTNHENFKIEY